MPPPFCFPPWRASSSTVSANSPWASWAPPAGLLARHSTNPSQSWADPAPLKLFQVQLQCFALSALAAALSVASTASTRAALPARSQQVPGAAGRPCRELFVVEASPELSRERFRDFGDVHGMNCEGISETVESMNHVCIL